MKNIHITFNLKDIFKEVKECLNNNMMVLFTGTPCQIDGLRGFLKNINLENLLLCDIVCHGVPSPMVFKDYIQYIEEKSGKKVIDYKCRDKSNGWRTHTEKAIYIDKEGKNKCEYFDIYKNLFKSHNILRPACHECRYTNLDRCSDITIADYWGIEKVNPEFDDNKGVSLILINSKKGKEIFTKISRYLEFIETNIDNCLQPQLIRPSTASIERDIFWKDYNKYNFDYIIRKYSSKDMLSKIRRKIRKTTMSIIKKS